MKSLKKGKFHVVITLEPICRRKEITMTPDEKMNMVQRPSQHFKIYVLLQNLISLVAKPNNLNLRFLGEGRTQYTDDIK